MSVNRAIEAGSLSDYLAANHAFHFALYEAAEAPEADRDEAAGWVRTRGHTPAHQADTWDNSDLPNFVRMCCLCFWAAWCKKCPRRRKVFPSLCLFDPVSRT